MLNGTCRIDGRLTLRLVRPVFLHLPPEKREQSFIDLVRPFQWQVQCPLVQGDDESKSEGEHPFEHA